MKENLYRLEQLAEAAGVAPRTVRFYTSQKLLPEPSARGRFALYDETYLNRLKLIQTFKALFLPLEVIRRQLGQMTDEQVEQALQSEPGELLRTFHLTPDPSRAYHEQSDLRVQEPAAPVSDATTYLARLRARQASGAAAVTPSGHAAVTEPDAVGANQNAAFPPMPASAEVPPSPTEAAPEPWQRVTLAPGVELHMRVGDDPAMRRLLTQLAECARREYERLQAALPP